MSDAAMIQAQLVDMRNVGAHKSLKLTLHIAEEYALDAIKAFGWPTGAKPVPVVLAHMNTGAVATPVREDVRQVAPPPKSSRNSYLTRAIMLPKDGLFRRWLEIESKLDDVDENEAAAYIRTRCGVTTRSEIKPGTEAATKLDFIESAFMCWRDAPRVGA